jgi:hypothetical protein
MRMVGRGDFFRDRLLSSYDPETGYNSTSRSQPNNGTTSALRQAGPTSRSERCASQGDVGPWRYGHQRGCFMDSARSRGRNMRWSYGPCRARRTKHARGTTQAGGETAPRRGASSLQTPVKVGGEVMNVTEDRAEDSLRAKCPNICWDQRIWHGGRGALEDLRGSTGSGRS